MHYALVTGTDHGIGLELARQLCQDYQVPNFSLNSAVQFYRLAQAKGHGADDSSSVVSVIRKSYEKEEIF